jgi:predicted alpha/beta hydrolase family esterase
MKRAIIIHGWTGKPTDNWFQWLAKELSSLGYKTETPEMPNSDNPILNDWMETLLSLSPDENTLLIGHSLSNSLILRYLEKPETKAKGAVLVAAWNWLMSDLKEFHQTFFETEFKYDAIKSKKIPIIIVNSTDDPYIDFKKSKDLSHKLDSKFIGIDNAGHFNTKAGYTQFPRLVEIIKEEIE